MIIIIIKIIKDINYLNEIFIIENVLYVWLSV